MNDVLKYLGAELRRFYDAAVRRPMSWRMIDALESIGEASGKERRKAPPEKREGSAAPSAPNGEARK